MLPNIHKHDEIVRTLRLVQQSGFKSAIIAGGAIRDPYMGIMPRDIDLFIWDPRVSDEVISSGVDAIVKEGTTGQVAMWGLMRLAQSGIPANAGGDHAERIFTRYGSGKITEVWNVLKNFLPFQVILTGKPPIQHVEDHFDFGLCKCYCDGEKFRYTPDFMSDAKNKTLTLTARDMTDREYLYTMNHHYPRMQQKFPGYTLVIPPWNEDLVAKHKKK